MELSVLYEDEDLMVINKAAGMPVHPSQGNFDNTLANGLAWYFKGKARPLCSAPSTGCQLGIHRAAADCQKYAERRDPFPPWFLKNKSAGEYRGHCLRPDRKRRAVSAGQSPERKAPPSNALGGFERVSRLHAPPARYPPR